MATKMTQTVRVELTNAVRRHCGVRMRELAAS
jgi:hypothetical protein